MIKLLTINVDFDTEINQMILIANVIANDSENIYIIKDLFEDHNCLHNEKVYKIILNHSKQYVYNNNDLKVAGRIFIKFNQTNDIDEVISETAKTILQFIL